MDRRSALKGIGSLALASCTRAQSSATGEKTEKKPAAQRTDVTFPITGFWNGMSFTRRSVQIA